ncbi:E3 ubiquitin-protein ligase PUB23-like [Lolium rigidum]|uniref:E3 ubiquitin-protein ligase PUB23-like n=1 Tax=Lolium rigidum TaxID=89674 RepID=UPI001F5D22F5|nr:E3 ubiquitin-protein ligase PUB23-like [Lolium rigidum]
MEVYTIDRKSVDASAAQVDVPSYFLCPISMEIMRDPVTLSSGITYDRESIERWVFTDGHGECPMTKQQLGAADREPTPNHTLRRLIQGWCAVHAVERFPTPRAPVDAARVASIVDAARRGHDLLAASLKELADIVAESDCNRRCVEAAPGAVAFLVSVLKKHAAQDAPKQPSLGSQSQEDQMYGAVLGSPKASSPEDTALSILHSLRLSEESWKRILERGENFLDTMASVLRRPSHLSRTYGIQLLKAAVSEMPPAQLTSASAELVEGVVSVVTDKLSAKAVKIALHVLCRLCLWGRNRVKAVEAGAVAALVELLLNECCGGSKQACELAIVVLDHLCGCAEGRLELVAHPAGLAVVARAATRLSAAGTESAVRALHAVARHSATPAVLQEMLAVGVVGRLLFLVQAGAAGDRPRERAREMLKMHARVWRGSPCFSSHLNASYPS